MMAGWEGGLVPREGEGEVRERVRASSEAFHKPFIFYHVSPRERTHLHLLRQLIACYSSRQAASRLLDTPRPSASKASLALGFP